MRLRSDYCKAKIIIEVRRDQRPPQPVLPALLPSCILVGVGIVFLILVSALPPLQVFALVGGTSVTIGLVLARLRREVVRRGPAARIGAEG